MKDIEVEGLADLTRALDRAQDDLAREFATATQRIGRRVAAILPGGGSEIPTRYNGRHVVELWGGLTRPGQSPRPFIAPEELSEFPDIEAMYLEGVDRALKNVSE